MFESDDEEEAMADENTHVTGSRAFFQARYRRVGMEVTLGERNQKLELAMRSMNPVNVKQLQIASYF